MHTDSQTEGLKKMSQHGSVRSAGTQTDDDDDDDDDDNSLFHLNYSP